MEMSGSCNMKMSGGSTAPGHVAGPPDHEQKQELDRAQLMLLLRERRRTQAQVAEQLGLTVRQVERLYQPYKAGGAPALGPGAPVRTQRHPVRPGHGRAAARSGSVRSDR